MKGLTIGCYAIAFLSLGVAMALLMQQTSLTQANFTQWSVRDFSALAHR